MRLLYYQSISVDATHREETVEMSMSDVAEMLQVSYATVWNYTQRSEDPLPVKHQQQQGMRVVRTFDSDAVRSWADRHGIPCKPA